MNGSFSPETIGIFPYEGLAEVDAAITATRPGRVHFQATYWPARFVNAQHQQISDRGTLVNVVGRRGLMLLVQPMRSSP